MVNNNQSSNEQKFRHVVNFLVEALSEGFKKEDFVFDEELGFISIPSEEEIAQYLDGEPAEEEMEARIKLDSEEEDAQAVNARAYGQFAAGSRRNNSSKS